MSIASTIEGTVVRFYTSTPFTDVSGSPADPSEVVFGFQVGSNPVKQVAYGNPASWGTIVRDSTGNYHVDVDTTGLAGVWTYVWASSGGVQTKGEGQMMVNPATVSVTL
jgi:hypothetical protein